MRARTLSLVSGVVLVVGACASSGAATESRTPWQPHSPNRRATLLAADDPRRRMVGTWEMEWRYEARRRRMRATLVLEDSLVQDGFFVRGLKGTLYASFASELDFVPPCFHPEQGVVGVEVSGHQVELEFSPGCADNNLSAEVSLSGDIARGRWFTWFFSTPPNAPRGSLTMRRIPART